MATPSTKSDVRSPGLISSIVRRFSKWLVLMLLPIGGCGWLIYSGFGALSEPVTQAMNAIAEDSRVGNKLGANLERTGGYAVKNYNSTNSNGGAEVEFNVKGPNGSAHVTGHMALTAGKWRADGLKVTFSDGTTLNIPEGSSAGQTSPSVEQQNTTTTPDNKQSSAASVDFHKLVAETYKPGEKPSSQSLDKLFGALVQLPVWHFVTAGDGKNAVPLTATLDGKKCAFAFTDAAHAQDFGKANDMADTQGNVRTLTMKADAAVNWINEQHKQGNVDFAQFNFGPHGWFIEAKALPGVYRALAGKSN